MKRHILAISTLLVVVGAAGLSKCLATSSNESVKAEQSLAVADVAESMYVVEYSDDTPLPIGKGNAVIVDFYATWCGPCRAYSPVFKQVAKKYSKKARFFRVDVDKFPALASKYNITSIPTTLVFRPDGTYSFTQGYIPAESLSALVERAIAGKK